MSNNQTIEERVMYQVRHTWQYRRLMHSSFTKLGIIGTLFLILASQVSLSAIVVNSYNVSLAGLQVPFSYLLYAISHTQTSNQIILGLMIGTLIWLAFDRPRVRQRSLSY